MADLAELELRINSLEIELARTRMDAATKSAAALERTTGLLERQFNSLNNTVRSFRILGSVLAAGFIATRVANSALISTIAEYESNLVTLKAVSVDFTASLEEQAAQMKKLDQAARETGRSTLFSAVSASEGLLILAKAGLSVQEAINTLPAVLNLAQGQLISIEAAATTVTSVLRQFGIAAVDASRVVDVLSETANRTSTDVTNLSNAFKFVGPIAAALNKNIEETAAALGVLANSGLQSSLAGTTLRGVLTALAGPTDVAKKTISGLGLTVEELNPATHSLDEIITTLAGSYLSTSDAVDIFNRRNAATALILIENISAFRELNKQNEENRQGALKLAIAQGDTLTGAFKKLSASFKDNILNQNAFKQGVRDTTDFLVDLLRVFAGSTDPILKANDSVNAFATALVFARNAIIALTVALAVNAINQYRIAIIEAAGATATFNAILKVNPLLIVLSSLTAVTFAVKLFRSEVRTALEEAERFGKSIDNQVLRETAKELAKLNSAIEDAAEQKDLQEALDLSTSKVNILKTAIKDISFSIKAKPQEAIIDVKTFQELLEAAITDKEVRVKVEAEVEKQTTDRVAEELRTNLNNALKGFDPFRDLVKEQGRFQAEIFFTNRQTTDELLEGVIPKQLFVDDTVLASLEGQVSNFFRQLKKDQPEFELKFKDPSERLAELGRQTTELIDKLAAEIVPKGELVGFLNEEAFGAAQEVLKGAVTSIEADIKKFQAALGDSSKGDAALEGLTERLADLKEEADKASESIEEFAQAQREEQEELRTTIGLVKDDVEAQKSRLEAVRLLDAAFGKRRQVVELEIQHTEQLIQKTNSAANANKDNTAALTNLNGKLERSKSVLAALIPEYDAQKAALFSLIELTKELAKAKEEENKIAEARKDARDVFISTAKALQDEADALDTRVKLLKANSDADKAFIQAEAKKLEILSALAGTTELEKLAITELVEVIGEELQRTIQLTESEEALRKVRKETTKDTKAQSEALRRIVQDLDLELELIGKSRVEQETIARLRRISSGLIEEEANALEDKLRPAILTTVKALDQAEKAEQLGRNVARAFSEPLKDILKGGDVEDAARKLLERLFDIFLEVNIFQPLEEQFAKAFSKNRGAQKIVAKTEFVNQEKAVAEINAVVIELGAAAGNLTPPALALDTAFTKAELAALQWSVISKDLLAAFSKSALEGKRIPGVFPGGPLPPISGNANLPGPTSPFTRKPKEAALIGLNESAFFQQTRPQTPLKLDISPRSLERLETLINRGRLTPELKPIQKTPLRPPDASLIGLDDEELGRRLAPQGLTAPGPIGADQSQTINSLVSAGEQLAAAFAPLTNTTANLVQATQNLQTAAPKVSKSAVELDTSTDSLDTSANALGESAKTLETSADSAAGKATFSGELLKGIFGQLSGILSGLFAGKFGFSLPIPFEKGGVFTNKMVTRPTIAPLALFGESGPEAIMPLQRSSGGTLGVSAFLRGKETATLKLTRGVGGKLGVDFGSLLDKQSNRISRFAAGGVFPTELGITAVGAPSRSIEAPTEKQTNKETSTQRPMQFVFNPSYNFGVGSKPDNEFRRAARQHESDLRDRTRRVFGG